MNDDSSTRCIVCDAPNILEPLTEITARPCDVCGTIGSLVLLEVIDAIEEEAYA